MTKNSFYDQLINSEPLGFINPLEDLGEFDPVQMKFREPVRQLVNKYSGKPYNLNWQKKIEEMRVLYIDYQKSLRQEEQKNAVHNRVRNKRLKEHVNEIVTIYLQLGFRFKEIETKVALFNTRLRRNWKRSDYVTTVIPEFYLKEELRDGYCIPKKYLPQSMKIN